MMRWILKRKKDCLYAGESGWTSDPDAATVFIGAKNIVDYCLLRDLKIEDFEFRIASRTASAAFWPAAETRAQ